MMFPQLVGPFCMEQGIVCVNCSIPHGDDGAGMSCLPGASTVTTIVVPPPGHEFDLSPTYTRPSREVLETTKFS